jgi:hypothetical protein
MLSLVSLVERRRREGCVVDQLANRVRRRGCVYVAIFIASIIYSDERWCSAATEYLVRSQFYTWLEWHDKGGERDQRGTARPLGTHVKHESPEGPQPLGATGRRRGAKPCS